MATAEDRIRIGVEFFRTGPGLQGVEAEVRDFQRRVQSGLQAPLQKLSTQFANIPSNVIDQALPRGAFDAAKGRVLKLGDAFGKMATSGNVTAKQLDAMRLRLEALQRIPLLGGALKPSQWNVLSAAGKQLAQSIYQARQAIQLLQGQMTQARGRTAELAGVKRILQKEMMGVSKAARGYKTYVGYVGGSKAGRVYMKAYFGEVSAVVLTKLTASNIESFTELNSSSGFVGIELNRNIAWRSSCVSFVVAAY